MFLDPPPSPSLFSANELSEGRKEKSGEKREKIKVKKIEEKTDGGLQLIGVFLRYFFTFSTLQTLVKITKSHVLTHFILFSMSSVAIFLNFLLTALLIFSHFTSLQILPSLSRALIQTQITRTG